MTFPEGSLKQTAVFWSAPTNDGYGGFSYGEPQEIPCRWVDTSELFTDANGQQLVSRAQVQVSSDLVLNGVLYLGTLDDLDSSEEASPNLILGAYTIKRIDKVPTVKGDKFYRLCYL